jgi:ABC-2 type transport system ATP-binding protein
MNDDIAISIKNVTKKFLLPHEKKNSVKSLFTTVFTQKKNKTTQLALSDVSFDVKKGEFFGIVGRNGSGKSTLLKIIAGIYQPTQGKVTTNGKLVPFIELGVGFNPELTGRENVFLNGAILGFARKQIQKNYKKIVEFAELEDHMDVKLKNYSSGMQVRLAFACATMADADILLIDEVLAVGDADFQRKCFSYFKKIKSEKKTVIFVTHDMSSVREYCDRALLIDESTVKLIDSSSVVSREYSKLFLTSHEDAPEENRKNQRWGNGQLRLGNIKSRVTDKYIEITAEVQIKEDTDKAIYGIHIHSEDGTEVTAMNNRMMRVPDLNSLVKGEKIHLRWKILNIFNDGKYSVSLTLISEDSTTLDWIVSATSFIVRRLERSTTAVFPPIEVVVNGK